MQAGVLKMALSIGLSGTGVLHTLELCTAVRRNSMTPAQVPADTAPQHSRPDITNVPSLLQLGGAICRAWFLQNRDQCLQRRPGELLADHLCGWCLLLLDHWSLPENCVGR